MQLVLFDSERPSLFPFTHTRAIADIRCGIFTMRERWERLLCLSGSGSITADYLRGIYPSATSDAFFAVNARIFGTPELGRRIERLKPGEALRAGEIIVAAHLPAGASQSISDWPGLAGSLQYADYEGALNLLARPWDLFSLNDEAIRRDYGQLTGGRSSAAIPPDVTVRGSEIFIEPDAIIGAGTILNATTGPIYIGRGAEIMEGCIARGPFALCEGAVLKMGAKIYSATTIGPGCKVGGEVSNAVFFANSNKGHDGFLGNAVIGEWCNLGADTNCSNLKNNYDEVKVWDEAAQKSVKTGLTFCGLLMGDHSKCGINTMFNTGTVAGVSCNIWGGGFPEKFLPSFSWGGPEGMSTYQLARAMDTAARMMARRGKTLDDAERAMLRHVFESTASSRSLIMGA